VIASRIYADHINKPRSRHVQVFGVSPLAARICDNLAPGGKWWVECDFSKGHQFMAWYSRYLPYAYAMMLAEDGFKATGIEFDSINAYFRTCMGFVDLGQGYGDVERNETPLTKRTKFVIEDDDLDLYGKCYSYSCKVKSPRLPFEEAYQPAICFVAYRRPDLFVKHMDKDGWGTKHVHEVAEAAGIPMPSLKWGKK
jgi:hypothetical protein